MPVFEIIPLMYFSLYFQNTFLIVFFWNILMLVSLPFQLHPGLCGLVAVFKELPGVILVTRVQKNPQWVCVCVKNYLNGSVTLSSFLTTNEKAQGKYPELASMKPSRIARPRVRTHHTPICFCNALCPQGWMNPCQMLCHFSGPEERGRGQLLGCTISHVRTCPEDFG